MKKRVKGSLTVEASFIISMTVIVIGVVISLWLYKYQVCWYTQAVNECLITGSNQSLSNDVDSGQITKMKWEDIKNDNYLVPQDFSFEVNGDEDEISMDVAGKVSIWGNKFLELDIHQKIGIVKPVRFIRKAAAVKEAIK